MRPLTLRRLLLQCSILVLILFVVVVIAVKFGAVPVSLYALGRDLLHVLLGQRADLSSDYVLIIKNIRLPRILLGIIVGASLSVAGTSFQALLRNPLADPYVLGVSSGAALGAILALLAAPAIPLMTPAAAFLGAAATIAGVYFLGRRQGQLDSGTLLLAGIVMASFLSAMIMFLMTTLASRELRGISFWLMGDLSTSIPRGLLWILVVGFLAAAGAPRGNIHPIPTDANYPEGAANIYEDELKSFYGAERLDPARPLFDLVLMGLGPDGHTASLFPGAPALEEKEHWVVGVDKAHLAPFVPRVTLTFPALASTHEMLFLVDGSGKRNILQRVFTGEDLPGSRAHSDGELVWLLDRAAAPALRHGLRHGIREDVLLLAGAGTRMMVVWDERAVRFPRAPAK